MAEVVNCFRVYILLMSGDGEQQATLIILTYHKQQRVQTIASTSTDIQIQLQHRHHKYIFYFRREDLLSLLFHLFLKLFFFPNRIHQCIMISFAVFFYCFDFANLPSVFMMVTQSFLFASVAVLPPSTYSGLFITFFFFYYTFFSFQLYPRFIYVL